MSDDKAFLDDLHRRLETPGATRVKPRELARLFRLAARGAESQDMILIPREGLPDAVIAALVEGEPPQRRPRRRKPGGAEP